MTNDSQIKPKLFSHFVSDGHEQIIISYGEIAYLIMTNDFESFDVVTQHESCARGMMDRLVRFRLMRFINDINAKNILPESFKKALYGHSMKDNQVNYCKDCKYREIIHSSSGISTAICRNDNAVSEDYGIDDKSAMLTYPYHEGGWFVVGEYFGCVHFEEKDNEKSD